MSTVTVELEQELWELFRPFYQQPKDAVREVIVLELYRRREISSGKAAELLKMERFEFIRYAARLGISFFDLDEDELVEEIHRAEEIE
jgi:predicted HTH domain antitoxin